MRKKQILQTILTISLLASCSYIEKTNDIENRYSKNTKLNDFNPNYTTEDTKVKNIYEDNDDLVGLQKVVVYNEENKNYEEKELLFGKLITDFNDYNILLNDTNNLKFNDKKEITGGFNEALVNTIINTHNNYDKKEIKFITEIVDEDKESVGLHNIVRKITVNGKEIFSKKDKAFINFNGTTIGIIDESFIDVDNELENRIYRVTPKSLDNSLNPFSKDEMERTHGTTAINSMIDEMTYGNSLYSYLTFYKALLSSIQTDAWKKFDVKTYYEFNDKLLSKFIQLITTRISENQGNKISENIRKTINNDLQLQLMILNFRELKDFKNNQDNMTEEQKTIILNKYKEMEKIVDKLLRIDEIEKLKSTDLHFATISAGENGKVNNVNASKYLSDFLDENKSVKVINMSYGNNLNLEEYIKLKNMTDDEKEKAALFYNSNPTYRTAIISWLKNISNKLKENYETNGNSYSDLSLYDYFKNKKEITKDDFDKLVQSKLGVYNLMLNVAPELKLANNDILFVRSNGNGVETSEVNLTDFDENGEKIIYTDPNKTYGNGFAAIPYYINEKNKEKALKENKEFVYDYTYRKNILTVVGLAPNILPLGSDATDKISPEWGLFTIAPNLYLTKLYGVGVLEYYNEMKNILSQYEKDNSKYSSEYIEEIKSRIKSIEDISNAHPDEKDKSFKLSFSRAGKSMLNAIASEGMYTYVKKVSDDEIKTKINPGSSFSAPRVSAVAGEILTKYPFLTAHQAKQLLLTNANDGYSNEIEIVNSLLKDENTVRGLYGVDDIIGWGILDKDNSLKGPRRFVKALTHETNDESFVANIPYGTYSFDLGIRGGFDKGLYLYSRGIIDKKDAIAYFLTRNFNEEEILTTDFQTLLKEKAKKSDYIKYFNDNNITGEYIVSELRPKLNKLIDNLPFEEKELFQDAGLIKDGNGTLILKGDNTYKEDTIVKNGTLILEGRSYSKINIEENAKLKLNNSIEDSNAFKSFLGLDLSFGGVYNDVINKGSLYSYSKSDRITQTYTPFTNSSTNILSSAKLSINKIDLSNIDFFDVNVFNKKGYSTFKKIDKDHYETETEIFEIKDANNIDNNKIFIGERQISPLITLKSYLENGSLKMKLIQNNINTNLETLSIDDFNKYVWFSTQEAKTLNGDLLADSLIAPFDINEVKNTYLKNILDKHNKSIFAGNINEFITHNRDGKNITISLNGVSLGGLYSFKHDNLGVSIDYIHSNLQDTILLDKNDNIHLGKVYLDNFGINILNSFNYSNFKLNSIINFNYIAKNTDRKIGDIELKNISSSDFLFNIENELSYIFKHKNLEFVPYLGLNLISYTNGRFDEDTTFGYKGLEKTIFKSKFNLGLKFNASINNFILGSFLEFSKYITDNKLTENVDLNNYNFTNEIKGVNLMDNNLRFGASVGYKKDGFLIDVIYSSKNLYNNSISVNLGFEF